METKCRLGWHGACASCDTTILPTVSHVHTFNRKRGGHEQLCGTCYAAFLAAAKLVLEALIEVRGDMTLEGILHEIDRGHVFVLVQTEIDLFGASN